MPPELIKAHGLQPVRLIPGPCGSRPVIEQREGMCEFMRMFCCTAASRTDAAGIVVTSTCDQMRRGADILKGRCSTPLFLMDVPSAWGNPSAHKYYRNELERFSRFLGVLGEAFSTEALLNAMQESPDGNERPAAVWAKGSVPVAVLGGPLSRPDMAVLKLIETLGGSVVLDALEAGERTRRAAFDRRRVELDPMGCLADAYYGAIPDVFLRPNSAMYQWLKAELPARGVRGVVMLRYVWCDLWHSEVGRLREWLEVPLLDIDLSGDEVLPRNRTRLEAFLENL